MKSDNKRHILGQVSTLAMLALMSTGTAMAQTAAPAADDGAVVVTGIKKGLQDSIALKRKSNSIVEAFSAEDIGKLPDISIADTLARLPAWPANASMAAQPLFRFVVLTLTLVRPC